MPETLVTDKLKNNYRLILGSASPRRQELLKQLGLEFEVHIPQLEEMRLPGEAPAAYARRNSREKACKVLQELELQTGNSRQPLVISADTIVYLDHEILEKPESADDARRMLAALSGRSHMVCSAFCIATPSQDHEPITYSEVVRTQVEFRKLSQQDIEAYLSSGEPFDKAGAYGIQGIAGVFVRRIEGSYTNVVGLPMAELWEALQAFVSES